MAVSTQHYFQKNTTRYKKILIMELKQYQQDTLNDLAAYMEQVANDNNLQKAYTNFWLKKGIDISSIEGNRFIHSYDNSTVPGVPRVMFKVPTAGGKTFIAANALKVIFDHLPSEHPRVVAWFVPSDSILKQTVKNLSNPQHPYRQRINTHFNNHVVIVDKEMALAGIGIQPNNINEQLTIFVLSVQSFIPQKNKKGELTNEGLRSLRENSSLAAYANFVNENNKVDNADETSLLQAIACLNPVVIVDESHNFGSDMRIDALTQINPCFILDLTATPREKSNIISFVDAKKLKDANMVKLPIVLYNRESTEDVLFDAIQLQRTLEKRAIQMREKGGRYIRPIVLFQAQPKSDKDNETFDKVKQKLVAAGIPENFIKIKTAEKDELKNHDLMDEECQVRYIITVNALKEGWDCPFAYILASLANKTSQIDVEQIVGRVLRLPYTTKHADEFLNLSYVFTSSNDFRQTIESVIKGLNNAGFSSKDTRIADTSSAESEMTGSIQQPETTLFSNTDDVITTNSDSTTENIEFDETSLKTRLEKQDEPTESNNNNKTSTDNILQQAHTANTQYEEENRESFDSSIPTDIKDKIMIYSIKEDFKSIAKQIKLPRFVKKIASASIFHEEGEMTLLTKAMLTEGFILENADKNITFEDTLQEAVRIDLEKRSEGEYVPKQYKMDERQLQAVRKLFAGYGVESKRNQLTGKIAKRLHFDEVNEPHISNYIRSVLSNKNDEELMDLFNRDIVVERAFKRKIDSLVADYQYQNFKTLLDKGQIKCEEQYIFPKELTLAHKVVGLSKGLYTEEGDMNNFEYQVITHVANLDNILFWHRNPERGQGFCINGYLNHYPDFIIYTHKGNTILLETKGDDRDNTDSRLKLELGSAWANKAGDKYRYFMVFDNTRIDGAYTKESFLDIIREL
jgi:type III restriction enzyme